MTRYCGLFFGWFGPGAFRRPPGIVTHKECADSDDHPRAFLRVISAFIG
jgi:hypothetical protein